MKIPKDIVDSINCNNFYFIQIGANDGIDSDPIREWIIEYDWSGIMFEPQKTIYQELLKLYKDNKKINCINSGIAEKEGIYKLYNHKLGHGGNSLLTTSKYININDYEEIHCNTFENIIKKYDIENINLLTIDTEGYDSKILNSIDFGNINIKNIWFEKWPDNIKNDKKMINNKFVPMGYSFKEYETDFFLSKDIK